MRPSAFAVLALLSAAPLSAQSPDERVPPKVLAALRDTLASSYVNPISKDSLARFKTAGSMILALLDRHTILLSPAGRRDFEVEAGASFGGIGASLAVRRDTTLIATVQPGSPSARAHLRPFDRIVSVGGQPVVGLPTDSIVSLIRGPEGTPVGLGLRRGLAGEAVQAVLIRAPVQIPSVPAGAMLPSGIGVIRVAQFGPETTREAVEALDWLVQGGAKGVVMDLRENPGGVLEEALGLAQLFVPPGTPLVDVRGRPGTGVNEIPKSRLPPRYPKLPVAIMVNERSASAAEVFAGAMQEAKRALIAGRQSYGKGSVQHIAALPEGWAVKMTIARWYTPSGRRIDRGPQPANVEIDPSAPHDGGVMPDFVLPKDSLPEEVTLAAMAAGPRWDSLNLAMLDWVQAAADTMTSLSPEYESDPAVTTRLLEQTGVRAVLPPGTEPAVQKFISHALSRGVIGGKFGVMEEGAWGLMHDDEVLKVAAELSRRAGS
jgi:carboxyl-terminal processing protease